MNSRPHAKETALAIALIVVAVALRAFPLTASGFWHDELFTLLLADHPPSKLAALTAHDVHPPLYYLVVRGFMLAGDAAGGFFAETNWLRIASLLPGLATVLFAWIAARRWWSRGAGTIALLAFAVSPALSYFAIELRGYALVQFAVFAATLLLIRIARRSGEWSPWSVAGYVAAMTVALYTHNLSHLYLLGHVLIFAAELLFNRFGKRFAIQGVVAGLAVALLYLPWTPVLLNQHEHLMTAENAEFLDKIGWRKLIALYFYVMPWGPEGSPAGFNYWQGGRLIVWIATMTFFALAILLLLDFKPRREETDRRPDRLFLYSLFLAFFAPLLSFALSHAGVARIAAGYRYHLIAQPFFLLVVVRALLWLRPAPLRIVFISLFAVFSAIAAIHGGIMRREHQNEARCLRRALSAYAEAAPEKLYWLNPRLARWVGRSDGFEFSSWEAAVENAELSPESDAPSFFWFVHHWVSSHNSLLVSEEARILATLLDRAPEAKSFSVVDHCDAWVGVWRASDAAVEEVDRQYQTLKAKIAERKNAHPGGLVILPSDPLQAMGRGWGPLELDGNLNPFCWTIGERQTLTWEGPQKPGDYLLRLNLWRPHPLPEPRVEIRYLLPGSETRETLNADVGAVPLEKIVRVEKPGQRLRLELETPVWRPAEHFEDSGDRRRLGVVFLSLEMIPQ